MKIHNEAEYEAWLKVLCPSLLDLDYMTPQAKEIYLHFTIEEKNKIKQLALAEAKKKGVTL